jgi:hypothetical protein
MDESTVEATGLVERVCAIDIGKTGLVACVRVPHESRPGRRIQQVREYSTTTGALLGPGRLATLPADRAGRHGGHVRLRAK